MFKKTFRQTAAIAVSLISLLASATLWANTNNTIEAQLSELEKIQSRSFRSGFNQHGR